MTCFPLNRTISRGRDTDSRLKCALSAEERLPELSFETLLQTDFSAAVVELNAVHEHPHQVDASACFREYIFGLCWIGNHRGIKTAPFIFNHKREFFAGLNVTVNVDFLLDLLFISVEDSIG